MRKRLTGAILLAAMCGCGGTSEDRAALDIVEQREKQERIAAKVAAIEADKRATEKAKRAAVESAKTPEQREAERALRFPELPTSDGPGF